MKVPRLLIVVILLFFYGNAHANDPEIFRYVGKNKVTAEELKALSGNGVILDEPREDSLTALHLASMHGRRADVIALVEAGADINTTDMYGHTALDFAKGSREGLIVEYLLEHNAKESRPWGINARESMYSKISHYSHIIHPILFISLFIALKLTIKRYSPLVMSYALTNIILFFDKLAFPIMYGKSEYLFSSKWSAIYMLMPYVILALHLFSNSSNKNFIWRLSYFMAVAGILPALINYILMFLMLISGGGS